MKKHNDVAGTIFDIQRFSTHDGPGARTVIFFKGCNLRCGWCHNPESIQPTVQESYDTALCIGCGGCDDECFSGARTVVGKVVTLKQVMEEVMTDLAYFNNTGGGVTFSGGECMLQIDFLEALLEACHEKGIHTAVDTAGHLPWAYFERILPYTEMFLYDVKGIDRDLHYRLTGVGNEKILDNLKRLSKVGAEVIVRIPLVMGANDSEQDAMVMFLRDLKIKHVEVLPYHRLGMGKQQQLGITAATDDYEVPGDEMLQALRARLRR